LRAAATATDPGEVREASELGKLRREAAGRTKFARIQDGFGSVERLHAEGVGDCDKRSERGEACGPPAMASHGPKNRREVKPIIYLR
jgi:hypothetical protein